MEVENQIASFCWIPRIYRFEFTHMTSLLNSISLSMENDQVTWKANSSGKFSSSSSYRFINSTGVKCKFVS
ncbi:hypothetical protein COCNU_02G007760 [Cocos nucifera]|uniref:Uncharacterized protein n=1 Tax=Cocos nucifera TaxID=13894 RepID=A0A8K0HZQ0_COCNU|nr:hypothetical protein COCNU_02G007760 [Cocos nucifera]